jgi:hypothetical protein
MSLCFFYYNLVFSLKLKNKNNSGTVVIRLEIVSSLINFLLDLLKFYQKI